MRYEVSISGNGHWYVREVANGQVARFGGLRLENLRIEEAWTMLDWIHDLDRIERDGLPEVEEELIGPVVPRPPQAQPVSLTPP